MILAEAFLFDWRLPEELARYAVLGITAGLIFLLYKEYVQPGVSFMLATVALLLLRLIEPAEALVGFSNVQIATVVLLVIITAALRRNYDFEQFFDRFFGSVKTARGFLLRVMPAMAAFSSFLNNTPIVAAMTPYVYYWAKKRNVSPAKLLIPLSFSTIVGGMITVLGTSTNLVLQGLLAERQLPLLAFEDFFYLGLIASVVGIVYLYTLGYYLLPDRRGILEDFREKPREYLIETQVSAGSELVGQTVTAAGLRNLKGLYLVEILRGEEKIAPVSPEEILHDDDTLIFAGNTETINELINSEVGLTLPAREKFVSDAKMQIIEALIPGNSALTGKTVKEADFREKYNAAVIAVHRNGERLRGKIGTLRLFPGDLLLLSIGKGFYRTIDFVRDLYVVSINRTPQATKSRLVGYVFLGLMALFAAGFAGLVPIFLSLIIILSILVLFKLISVDQVKKEVDFNLVAVLTFSQALSLAITNTGAASLLAEDFLFLVKPFGIAAVITGLFAITVFLTSFVTNVAAVSVVFPIAAAIGQQMGIDGTPLFVTIAFSASAAFLTPIGYQTNLIVYGPGRYTFRDFLVVGMPMLILHAAVCIVFILFYYGLLA